MKKLLVILSIILAPIPILAGGFKDLPKSIEKIESCTVMLTKNDEKREPLGSGITVQRGKDFYVWTDAHVVEKQKEIRVVKLLIEEDKEVGRLECLAEIVDSDIAVDVALLKIKRGGNSEFFGNSRFYLENKILPRGTDVILVGHFLSFPLTTPGWSGALPANIGGFKHISKEHNKEVDIIHNGGVIGGCSGSGVWLEDGRCIGLVYARYSTNEVLYTPIRIIKKWAQEKNLLWALDENVKKTP